jgi:hypothetical protein
MFRQIGNGNLTDRERVCHISNKRYQASGMCPESFLICMSDNREINDF